MDEISNWILIRVLGWKKSIGLSQGCYSNHLSFSNVSLWQVSTIHTCTHTRLHTQPPPLSLCSPPPLWDGSGWLAVLLALTGFCLRPDSKSIWQVPLSTQFLPTPRLRSLCKCSVWSIWLSFLYVSQNALFLFRHPSLNQVHWAKTMKSSLNNNSLLKHSTK